MKNLIWILLLLTSTQLQAQKPVKLLIITSKIDQLVKIERLSDGREVELPLGDVRASKGCYVATIRDVSNTSFRVKCKGCKQEVSFCAFSPQKEKLSMFLTLESGEEVKAEDCFSQSSRERFGDMSTAEQVREFIRTTNSGLNDSKRRPVTMGGPDPDDPQMSFYQSDSISLLRSKEFSFQWLSYKPIESIYIIAHDYEMVLESRDAEEANSWVKKTWILESEIPSWIPLKINEDTPEEKVALYSLDFNSIKSSLKKIDQFEPGMFYQLGVELKNDGSKHNPYLINFNLYSAEELEYLEDFFAMSGNLNPEDD